jgi:hypothetical protein
MPRHIWRTGLDLRRRLYEILEHGTIGNRTGLIVGRHIVLLIITNLVAMTLDSVPALQAQYAPLFIAIELLSLVVFTIEYGLRAWVAAEHAPHRHLSERRARWEFVSSPLGVIDLLAVLPFWFAFVLPGDLRVLLVFRMVRFLKLARYSPAMRSLLDVLYSERRALFGCFVILLGATLLAASVMHVVERHAQPDKFGTSPEAMWWAIVTLGTIGCPLIPCISSLAEKWRLSSSTSAFGWAPVISSARSRCCAGRADPRPLPLSREQAFSCSMPTICTSLWSGNPVSRSASVKWLAPDWAATSSRARAILSSRSSKKRRPANGRQVATVVHDAKVNATTCNKWGLLPEARA